MSSSIESLVNREYQYGFVTEIEADTIAPGLNEDVIRLISSKKNEPDWLLDWRLKAFRRWQTMTEPHWPNVTYTPIDYQKARYYSAPKSVKPLQSLDEVDPELLKTYQKLGISLTEQKLLAGVAVDAIFASVSVGTTMKEELSKHGVIFCSFGEAVQHHPELVRKYLGSVVPYSDNFFAALNSVEMATQPWALLQWMGERKDSTALKFFDDWVKVHRLKHLETVLAERDWLAGSFSVADILFFNKGTRQVHAWVMDAAGIASEGPIGALPGALPLIMTGVKLGVGLGLILIAIAEMVGAKSGLGYMIWNAWEILSVETMYVGLITIALLGLLFTLVLNEIERLIVPWKASR